MQAPNKLLSPRYDVGIITSTQHKLCCEPLQGLSDESKSQHGYAVRPSCHSWLRQRYRSNPSLVVPFSHPAALIEVVRDGARQNFVM
jgi:hypothetical protein